jgi:hypothetical protein
MDVAAEVGMAFFGDIGAREEERGPIWGPFAVVRENVERLVVVNVAWAVQLIPGILALAFPGLPGWVRVVMGVYSATAAIPATGVLFALALAATRGEHLSLELAGEKLRELAVPSFRTLAPLYGVFGALIWGAVLVGPAVPVVTTVATLGCLLWYLCATYWGPLFVGRPGGSAWSLAAESVRLVWRFPAETLATALAATVALVVGFVSVGGLVLIVPVVIALLQTRRYLDVTMGE